MGAVKKEKKTIKKSKPAFEKVIDASDGKTNVLVLGTSGSGKSTLINSFLGGDYAETGFGSAITKEITVYQKDDFPIRLIDTVGLEFSKRKQNAIKSDLKKFVKNAVKDVKAENIIHTIWLCIDGTVHRIDKEVLNYIRDISKVWKDVPIIVVFTKSYSEFEIPDNIKMFNEALKNYKHGDELNIKEVIPVVAKAYPVKNDVLVPPFGLDDLADATLKCSAEGFAIAKSVVKMVDLRAKRAMAYSIMVVASGSAATIGAIPLPDVILDSTLLVPMQSFEIKSISNVYGINQDNIVNSMIEGILEAGAVTLLAKMVLGAIKAIPGLQIAGAVLNAVVASVFTFIVGEVTVELSEGIYTGKIDADSINWIATAEELFKKYGPAILNALGLQLRAHKGALAPADIAEIIKAIIPQVNKDN